MTIDYARASQAILEQSDMLLAVWDGSASRGAGGTADMIAKARAKGTPVMILDPRTGQTDVTARAIQQHLAHNERGEERDRQGPP